MSGLNNGTSGLWDARTGLWGGNSGLWSGASGLVNPTGGSPSSPAAMKFNVVSNSMYVPLLRNF